LSDPGGLFAFDASLIKLVTGALKNVETMTELLEFLRELVVDGERIGREEEILFGEKAFGGKGSADGGKIGGDIGHRKDCKLQIPSSKLQRNFKFQTSKVAAAFGVWCFFGAWNLELYRPAAIRFNAFFTKPSALVIEGSCVCKSRTVRCASTCL